MKDKERLIVNLYKRINIQLNLDDNTMETLLDILYSEFKPSI